MTLAGIDWLDYSSLSPAPTLPSPCTKYQQKRREAHCMNRSALTLICHAKRLPRLCNVYTRKILAKQINKQAEREHRQCLHERMDACVRHPSLLGPVHLSVSDLWVVCKQGSRRCCIRIGVDWRSAADRLCPDAAAHPCLFSWVFSYSPFHSSSSLGPGLSQYTKQMGISQRARLLGKLVSYMADYT